MQRLLVPLVLLAIAVGAFIASERLGESEVVKPVAENIPRLETPLLSARRMPETLILPLARETLVDGLEAVLEESPTRTCLIVSDNGREIFRSTEQAQTLTPASTQKIITAFVALETLGPDYTFTTRIMSEDAAVDGVIAGNLYLIGGGDPLLMTDDYAVTYADQPQIRTRIEDLADAISDSGITVINGGVLPVERRYDDERVVSTWPERFGTQDVAGPLSALMIDDGFSSYPLTPDARTAGEQAVKSADPGIHAARLFDDLLEARGIVINSGARAVSEDQDLADLVPVAEIVSPPLSEIVRQMMTQSDNTTAELLLKELGLDDSEEGSTSAGARTFNPTLEQFGITPLGLAPRDGSGLDGGNSVPCDTLIGILDEVGFDSDLGAAFPTAGEDGTLRDRFRTSSARGLVHAKTGTLNNVTALAGFAEAGDGRVLEFAYIANTSGDETISEDLVDLQEPLTEVMVAYPEGPSIEDLAPPGQVERPVGTPLEDETVSLDDADDADAADVGEADANAPDVGDGETQDGEPGDPSLGSSGSEENEADADG